MNHAHSTAVRKIAETRNQPYVRFVNREDAGRQLVGFLQPAPQPAAVVLALPRGGIPVAAPLAQALQCPLAPVLVRKLPLPHSPEMGFGAVSLDGSRELNRRVVDNYGLSQNTIEDVTQNVLREVERRADLYGGVQQLRNLAGKPVYLVDDGIATGYSMLAAARMVRNQQAHSLTIAAPVAPQNSLESVAPWADTLVCLVVQQQSPFAVASFYEKFKDLTDEEVRNYLR